MWKEIYYFIAHVGYGSDKLSYRRKFVPKLKISFTVSDMGHILVSYSQKIVYEICAFIYRKQV